MMLSPGCDDVGDGIEFRSIVVTMCVFRQRRDELSMLIGPMGMAATTTSTGRPNF